MSGLWDETVKQSRSALEARLDPKATVRRLLAGEVIPELASPRVWARALPLETALLVEDLALAQTDIIYEGLEALEFCEPEFLASQLAWINEQVSELDAVCVLLREIRTNRPEVGNRVAAAIPTLTYALQRAKLPVPV